MKAHFVGGSRGGTTRDVADEALVLYLPLVTSRVVPYRPFGAGREIVSRIETYRRSPARSAVPIFELDE